jgi:hypothetical protein
MAVSYYDQKSRKPRHTFGDRSMGDDGGARRIDARDLPEVDAMEAASDWTPNVIPEPDGDERQYGETKTRERE